MREMTLWAGRKYRHAHYTSRCIISVQVEAIVLIIVVVIMIRTIMMIIICVWRLAARGHRAYMNLSAARDRGLVLCTVCSLVN